MNSSWKGYFASHQDAIEFSELQGFSIYDCSFCKPHEKPTISKTVRKEFTDGYSNGIKHENDSIEEILLLIRILEGSPNNEQEIDMLNSFPVGQYRRGYLKKLKEIPY